MPGEILSLPEYSAFLGHGQLFDLKQIGRYVKMFQHLPRPYCDVKCCLSALLFSIERLEKVVSLALANMNCQIFISVIA